MKEQLTHILDQSVCLSRKQMKEYLSGSMLPEEVHAAEVHISSCPLCSMAMEGFEEHSEDALAAIASLNSGFLKEHFDNIAPQIHLNSMAPAAALNSSGRRKTVAGAWIRPASIAAGLLLVCAGAWYLAKQTSPLTSGPDVASSGSVQPAAVPANDAGGNAQTLSAAAPGTASSTPAPATKQVPSETVAQAAKTTVVERNALARKDQAGTAHYYQPEPIPVDDASSAKAATETLPSANDPNKIYKGDISTRTTKVYVPPATEAPDAMSLTATPSKPAATPAKPAAADNPAPESKPAAPRESADQLFERGEYRSALSKYRQQLKNADADTRNHASLQAARCYAAIGDPDRAEALLRKVMDEGNGPERRTARRLLRNLR